MLQKSMMIILVAYVVLVVCSFQIEAFAAPINYEKCDTAQYHHCMDFLPQQNTYPLQGAPNWHVEIHLPQNGANVIDGILSPGNFTDLKQSPFVGAVENIYTTGAAANLNYCPTALYILQNQDGYFDKIKNFTNLIYPDYCMKESGPNPFPVPEFAGLTIALIAGITSAIVVSMRFRK